MRFRVRSLIVIVVLAAIPLTAAGQQKKTAPPAPAASQKKDTPPQPASPARPEQVLYLIRSTLLTLSDANRTGNYTVLRDLAAPNFRARNTSADLAGIFANLRRSKVDLFAVALLAPKLSTPPYLDPNRMLRLTGFFPTRPLQINFDLTFQNVRGHWQLFGISVATPQAPQPPQPQAQKPAPTPHTIAVMPVARPSTAPPASVSGN